MKYELEVYCDGIIGVRKIETVPLWNCNLIFNDISSLKKYLIEWHSSRYNNELLIEIATISMNLKVSHFIYKRRIFQISKLLNAIERICLLDNLIPLNSRELNIYCQ